MRVTREHTFEHPVEQCWEMFRNPDSHVAKFVAMGHRDLRVLRSEQTDDRLVVVIERTVDVDVPGFARKVMKPSNTLRTIDEWRDRGDGTYGGRFDLESRGVPIEIGGTTLLEPAGEGRTRYEISVDLTVRVPLIGARIAQFARGTIEAQLDEEFHLGDVWLSSH